MNCLIVDDEPEIREILRDLLQPEIDGTIYEATNGAEALEILENPEHSIQLVLTDLTMPKMSGTKLITEIRARMGTAAPKIFIVTGRVFEGDSQADFAADGRLQKPFASGTIREMVKNISNDILGLNQTRRE